MVTLLWRRIKVTEDIILIFILFLLIFVQLVYIVVVQTEMTNSLMDTIQNDSLSKIIKLGEHHGS